MRSLVAALIFATTLSTGALAQPMGSNLTLPIDQTVKIDFGSPVRDVVIANPMMVDVTLLGSGNAVLLGKEYGITTVTAFDASGRTVFSRRVVVGSSDDNRVAYYKGTVRNNFVCAPGCEQVAMPGEPSTVFSDLSTSYTGYSGRVTTATGNK